MSAMESCFLLIDEEGHLWIWYNDMSQPIKAPFAWNKTETIIAIGCNMFRATVLLESNQLVTFYDKSFKGLLTLNFFLLFLILILVSINRL